MTLFHPWVVAYTVADGTPKEQQYFILPQPPSWGLWKPWPTLLMYDMKICPATGYPKSKFRIACVPTLLKICLITGKTKPTTKRNNGSMTG